MVFGYEFNYEELNSISREITPPSENEFLVRELAPREDLIYFSALIYLRRVIISNAKHIAKNLIRQFENIKLPQILIS